MKKKFIFSLFAIITVHLSSFSQEYSIIGKVVDSINSIEFSNVILKDQNNKIVKGTTTSEQGIFELRAQEGTYTLTISFLGYEDWSKKIMLDQNQDLGTITLSESKSQLGEVVVVAEKPIIEKKVDRLVFNVENSITASGGSALDALRKTPGVTVQNDEISIIGKGSIAVLIDDRIVQLSGEELVIFLRSIASDDIKSIEVITTPPAKYDAEGTGGLINIQYKKGRRNAWNNSIRSTYRQATFPSYSLGNTFSYNKNKLRVLTSVNAKKGNAFAINDVNAFYDNDGIIRNSNLNLKEKEDYFSGRLGVDYDLSKNASVGIQYLGTIGNSDEDNNNLVEDLLNHDLSLKQSIISKEPKEQSILSKGIEDGDNSNHSANLHYIQQLDSIGKKFSVDLDYFTYRVSRDKEFTSRTFNSKDKQIDFLKANNTGDQKIENYSAKIDMEHPISWAKMSYGAKASFSHTDNLVRYFDITIPNTRILDPEQSDDFDYTENTQAVYFDLAKEFGKKWQAKLGLRAEHTQTEGLSQLDKTNSKKNKYTKWFPTVYLLHTINDNHSVNVNYNRRIRRPRFWELNPFRFYLDQTSYIEGNPSLQPAFTDKVEASHTYKNRLISSASFSVTTNGFGLVPRVDINTRQQIFTRENYYTLYQYGVSETYIFNPSSWWRSQNQANVFYSQFKINDAVNFPDQKGLGAYLSTNNSFSLNKKKTVRGEINFLWRYPGVSGVYKVNMPYYRLNLGLSMSFLDKKLQCLIALNDLLKTVVFDMTTFTSGIRQDIYIYNDTRSLKVSLKYNFGNNKISVKGRKFGNQDEKNRTN